MIKQLTACTVLFFIVLYTIHQLTPQELFIFIPYIAGLTTICLYTLLFILIRLINK